MVVKLQKRKQLAVPLKFYVRTGKKVKTLFKQLFHE